MRDLNNEQKSDKCGGLRCNDRHNGQLLPLPANAAEVKTPQYQTNARQMEKLNRGLIAVKTTADTRGQAVNGVYLS